MEEETNKKKLKKLKKRVKSLEENQCYMEQQLDKLTDPKPMLKFDDLDLGFVKCSYNDRVKLTQEQLDNENMPGIAAMLNAETDEEYTNKIEELETILRQRGVNFNYQKHLEHLVKYSNPSSEIITS